MAAPDPGTSRSTVRARISFLRSEWSADVNATGENVYTILELTSFVAAHKVPPLPAEPTFLISTPTKRNPLPYPNEMLAAEILVPTPNEQFPAPYSVCLESKRPFPRRRHDLHLLDRGRRAGSHLRGAHRSESRSRDRVWWSQLRVVGRWWYKRWWRENIPAR
jgi:hypothetical protein